MKDFRLFEITDFVMDEDFIRWVFENKPADEEAWKKWLSQNPDKHLMVAEARRILESLKIEEQSPSDQHVQEEIDKLMMTIRPQATSAASRFSIGARRWLVAASIALIALTLAAFYFFTGRGDGQSVSQYNYTAQVSSRPLMENINTSNSPTKVSLPDGSVVTLAPESRISYANSFDSAATRDVYLSGEAFFSVVKNQHQPFRVFSNEIITKVLGTSFSVKSFEKDSTIQIIVKTGKVSVYTQAGKNRASHDDKNKLGGILLTANQQLVYAKIPQTFQKVIAESPSIIEPTMINPNMAYDDVPLHEVFQQLSAAYGINIIYDTELLKNCTVTADIRNESFYHQLDLVCEAVGARYELMDGQVVIQSRGCD